MNLQKSEYRLPPSRRWTSLLTMMAGLLLVLCLGAMLIAQYRAQVDVYRNAQRYMVGHTEKLATLLDFFFKQCRKDVEAIARSHQVRNYLKRFIADESSENSTSTGSDDLKAATHRFLEESRVKNSSYFSRIQILDEDGLILYDTREPPPSAGAPSSNAHPLVANASATETKLVADATGIAISARVLINNSISGHVTAWIESLAAIRPILTPQELAHCYNNLMSNTGQIYFPDQLPDVVQSCGQSKLTAIPPGILSPLTHSCDGTGAERSDYLAITLPIPHTPLYVISIAPVSDLTGILKPWHYAVIMFPLAAIFLMLYIMQLRISLKHKALKNHYAETHKQHRIMVQNNEDLANEIILRKQAEAELKIINENLEEIVRHRTRKLESAMSDLKNTQSQLIQSGKLASIGELAAGIAHELNQPLMVIRGNAQLMERVLLKSPENASQLPDFFDTIERNTKRMISIINHLRTFSRQSGKEQQPVDINKVINNAFLMIGEQLRLRDIKTVTSLAEDLPSLTGDPFQLEQVVLNLLTNARDAIESYQSSKNGYRRKKQIEITTRIKKDPIRAIEILFSDTGCGIHQEDKEKIFDPFFTTKAVGKGTGLGLSITYGILQEHNGSLEVLSSEPGNTTFSVVLPV